MATVSDINSQLVTYTRDQERDRFTRSYQVRQPAADVSDGTQPFLDASVHADTAMVLYNDASTIADATNLSDARGQHLLDQGAALGQSPAPATGAEGFVQIVAASGGTTIQQGDEIKEPNSGLRFRCLATALYANRAQVAIAGIDVGTSTNLAAGTVLQWTAPRPGCGPTATVVAQSDGSGLTGGHPAETDDEYSARLIELRANPPASGNDSEYQRAIATIPGIAVEQGFTYPAVRGPGTMSFVFTLRTNTPGASRIPNGAQIATAEAALVATEPSNDGIFAATLTASPVTVAFQVTWSRKTTNWADSTQWPPFDALDPAHVSGSGTRNATAFRITSSSVIATPLVGQTMAFFDPTSQAFVRKRIATVTVVLADHTWDILCSVAVNASDTSYVPFVGQVASPWSESLQSIVAPVLSYFASLGPGEQVSPLPEPGARQRRQPEAPESWPNAITNRLVDGLFGVVSINDAVLSLPAVPHATPTGTAGVLSYLLTLGDLSVFAQ